MNFGESEMANYASEYLGEPIATQQVVQDLEVDECESLNCLQLVKDARPFEQVYIIEEDPDLVTDEHVDPLLTNQNKHVQSNIKCQTASFPSSYKGKLQSEQHHSRIKNANGSGAAVSGSTVIQNNNTSDGDMFGDNSLSSVNTTVQCISPQEMKCTVCWTGLSTRHSLIKHVFTHVINICPPSYICFLCSIVYQSPSELDLHSCSEREKRISCRFLLVRHVFNHHPDIHLPVYVCPLCGDVCADALRQKLHNCGGLNSKFHSVTGSSENRCKHEPQRENSCDTCMCCQQYKSGGVLSQEQLKCTNLKNLCLSAKNKEFNSLKNEQLSTYKMINKFTITNGRGKRCSCTHSVQKPLMCAVCGKKFSQPCQNNVHVNVNRHFQSHVNDLCENHFKKTNKLKSYQHIYNETWPFVSDNCGKDAECYSSLKSDQPIEDRKQSFTCAVFASSGNAGKHFYNHSRQQKPSVHVKGNMLGEFSISVKKNHQRFMSDGNSSLTNGKVKHFDHDRLKWSVTYTKEQQLVCSVCGKASASPSDARKHFRIHTGERPFVCDICGRAFSTVSTLNSHYRIHTGERPYTCNICEMAFTQLGNLKRHKLTHNGEKPFSCAICGKCFTAAHSVKVHQKTHSRDELPYTCENCGKKFLRSDSLRKHSKKHIVLERLSSRLYPRKLLPKILPAYVIAECGRL